MKNPLKVINFVSKMIVLFFITAILALFLVQKAEYVNGAGEVIPHKVERVYSKVEGEIEIIHKDFGDNISKGDVVLEISRKDLERDLMENQIRINEIMLRQRENELDLKNIIKENKVNQLRVEILKLDIKNLKSTFEETKFLVSRGQLPEQELKTREVNIKQRELELERLENTFETDRQKVMFEYTKKNLKEQLDFYKKEESIIKKDLELCIVKSEQDNYTIITKSLKESTGSSVQRGSLLYTIADVSKLKMVISLQESKIGKIKEGQKARVYLDAIPYEKFTTLNAVVSKVYPQANAEDEETYNKVELEITGFSEKMKQKKLDNINLKSGLKGTAKITVKEKKMLAMFIWDKIFE